MVATHVTVEGTMPRGLSFSRVSDGKAVARGSETLDQYWRFVTCRLLGGVYAYNDTTSPKSCDVWVIGMDTAGLTLASSQYMLCIRGVLCTESPEQAGAKRQL